MGKRVQEERRGRSRREEIKGILENREMEVNKQRARLGGRSRDHACADMGLPLRVFTPERNT